MTKPDPIAALGLGLAEDHKAEKRGRGRPRKDAAATVATEAKAEATDAGSPADEAEALATVVEEKAEEAVAEVVNETPAPVPPAPGDDAQSVFDRRLARLDAIVDEADFETGTAFGDLRDVMLDLFKHRPKVWTGMSQTEQQDAVRAIEAAAKRIISKVVLVVAQEDSDTIEGTFLGNFTVKGEAIEAKLKIDGVDGDVLGDVYKLAGHKVVIVSADTKRFMSARRTAETQPDQTEIPFADAPRPAPTPPVDLTGPEGDSDLNPEDDDEEEAAAVDEGGPVDDNAVAEATETAETATDGDGKFGVFDTLGSSWLETADGEDWSADKAKAGTWAHEQAVDLADAWDDEENPGRIVARLID